ncbi:MAG: DNA topoisomerase IB [Bauldia sp.]|nr:DNA topoisomerase IB [Bauldia sp.]
MEGFSDAAITGEPSAVPPAGAGLHYVSTDIPGLLRRRTGRGFRYLDPDGRRVEDSATLDRVRALGIPPAWSDVWICLDESGHVQAVGRDAKGRKQYIYHDAFRRLRDLTKYDHLVAFARGLPKLRQRVAADLRRPGVPREKALAAVVGLLERTLIRVGNSEYARATGSYGLTTLRDPHVRIDGDELRFLFRGKSGKAWSLRLRDRRLARIVRQCQELPGQHLFQYRAEDGSFRAVTSTDVNAYLREATGRDVTAKDFRTWHGTVMVAEALARMPPPATVREGKSVLRNAVAEAADRLGNTVTICRQSYVHPAVIEAYLGGGLTLPRAKPVAGLSEVESAVLAFLARRRRRMEERALNAER